LEVSIGGAVVADILAATGVIDGLYRGAGDVACVWIGTNDLRTLPDTAATVYSRITSWIQGRQAAGFRVIVLTILPCTKAGTPAGYEAERLDLNTLINANAAGADGIADIAADALLDDADDPVYFFDKLHLTTAGYGVVAGIVEAAIDILA